jgi:hypothetical protein
MYIELLSLQCRQEVLTQYQDQGLTVADDTHVGRTGRQGKSRQQVGMHMWSMFLDNKKMEGDKPLTAVETNY